MRWFCRMPGWCCRGYTADFPGSNGECRKYKSLYINWRHRPDSPSRVAASRVPASRPAHLLIRHPCRTALRHCSGRSLASNPGRGREERDRRCGYDLLEAPPGFEPGIEDLQSSALPLGDGAVLPERSNTNRKPVFGQNSFAVLARPPGALFCTRFTANKAVSPAAPPRHGRKPGPRRGRWR